MFHCTIMDMLTFLVCQLKFDICVTCDMAFIHYNDITMSILVSQITSLTIVYSTVCSGRDERKHQTSASLAFVRGIHQWPMNFLHKGPVTWKMFPSDNVIMLSHYLTQCVLGLTGDMELNTYCKISNIRRPKSPNLHESRLVLNLSLPNLLKPCVK